MPDSKIAERILKLARLADSTTYPAERDTVGAEIGRLCRKHGLSLVQLRAEETARERAEIERKQRRPPGRRARPEPPAPIVLAWEWVVAPIDVPCFICTGWIDAGDLCLRRSGQAHCHLDCDW